MSAEQISNGEQLERRKLLVESLTTNPRDPETQNIMRKWLEQEEMKRGEGFGSEIPVIIEQALVYRDAGLLVEACDTLDDARQGAENMEDKDMLAKIDGIINSL